MLRRIVLPVAGLTALLHLPWLLVQGFPVRQDTLRATLPWWAFTRREILAGNAPLWDPARLSGTPHLANIQVGVFYPPNWPLVPLPPHVAIGISLACHVALGGVLLALLARSMDVRDSVAVLAGMAFVVGAFVSSRTFAGHLQIIQASAWAPLVLLASHRLALRAEPRWAGVGTLAAALSLLAGYPAITAYALGAAGVIFLGSLPGSVKPGRALGLVPIGLLLAALITAPATWPLLQLVDQTTRAGGLPLERAASGALRPIDLAILVWPWFYGAEPLHSFVAGDDWFWHEVQGAGGLALSTLAVYGVWSRRRQRPVQLLVLIAAGSLLLAVGTRTPVYTVLYELVPVLGSFRIPARFLVIWALVLPVLAAVGLEELLRRRSSKLPLAFWLGTLAGVSAVAIELRALRGTVPGLHAVNFEPDSSQFRSLEEAARTAGLLNVCAGVAGLGLLALLARARATGKLPLVPSLIGMQMAVLLELLLVAAPSIYAPATPVADVGHDVGSHHIQVLRSSDERVAMSNLYSLGANLGTLLGYRNATAYDPLLLGRTTRLLRAKQTIGDPWGPASNEVFLDRDGGVTFDVLGIGYFLEYLPGTGVLWPRSTYLPRLSLVERARSVRTPAESLAAVLAPGFDPHTEAILEGTPPIPQGAGAVPGRNTIRIVRERPGLVEARVEAPRGGYLLFSESYFPGWRAESGGRVTPLVPADHAIMATHLAPGVHDVTLRFTAHWLLPSLLLCSLGVLALIALLLRR